MLKEKVVYSATLIVILLHCLMSLACQFADSPPKEHGMQARFEQWMAKYGRHYKDEAEKARRFNIFKANAEFVDSHNANKRHRSTVGLNHFSDLTDEEIQHFLLGFVEDSLPRNEQSFPYANMIDIPTNMD